MTTNHPTEIPHTEKRNGKLIYRMEARLDASPRQVWAKIANVDQLLAWDSQLLELKGDLTEGGRIELRSKMSPKHTFKLKVSNVQPNQGMIWSSGMKPLFSGVRAYRLEPIERGTRLHLEEVFSGWMLPFMQRQLPDCETLFGTYVRDLRTTLG
jgi:hypothetical protein